ncbi:GntR family transcriptional regulator [Spirillospora albida]|uniref:GntR family transcriptional regulator n=1 Tax=Spirillospora albida TaxID=58123 RepID=UPI0004BEE310|nr:GntR family transcriptional regulator [Spirillospora albida]
MPIDLDGPTPLYLQIADDLQRRIAAGEIGRRLPGVRVIAETYGVAHATANRSVQELVARGAVITVPGRGTFVAPPPTADA